MNIELSKKQYRRLLDLVYIGNWILNSYRDSERFADYDEVESLIFSYCQKAGMSSLASVSGNQVLPSVSFAEGGIHEAIAEYENISFFDILAEELARRDLGFIPGDDYEELLAKIEDYTEEFIQNGLDNILLDI